MIRYALVGWPGDEYHAQTNQSIQITQPSTSMKHSDKMKKKKGSYRSHPYNRFQQHKNETSENDEDKRPSSMKSRYFSIENVQIVNQSETIPQKEENSNKATSSNNESEQFLQRRDYLFKKLLQSRTLPDATCENAIQTVPDVSLPTKASLQTRKHSFQDEFIPLSKDKTEENQERNDIEESESSQNDSVMLDESSKRKDYNPKLNTLESYKGPYPIKCLMRTRQYLIDCFKPYSTVISRSNFESRLFEILKMKMNIRSKFDEDAKLWRKIKRETAIERQLVYDRIESQNRRYKHYMQKLEKPQSKHTYIADETSSEEETTDSDCVFEKSVIKGANDKKKIVEIDLDDDEDEYESNNLIKMISNVDTYENLDYEEDDNDDIESLDTDEKDNDPDSKCVQFGNYSKTKDSNEKNVKSSRSGLRRKAIAQEKSKKQKKSTKSQSDQYRIDRIGLKNSEASHQDETDELTKWELKYKRLRNQRNKLLRKKKSIEINTQREFMSTELKKIRKTMKKIRKNSKAKAKKSSSNSSTSFSHKSKKIKI